ncbi:MAG TPA: DUF1801 domain-containing protein [Thermomicrobiales bacterium]|nr:DUF1801 domain-containing protein [Thermomicrobiales bacterium]
MARPCATIDEYIGACPADVQPLLERVRRTIRDAVPAAGETISYGLPTITCHGRDLLSFAAWKHHIGLYPLPAVDDAFARELAPYRAAKSTVRFPLGQPLPDDMIARLAALHVAQRVGGQDMGMDHARQTRLDDRGGHERGGTGGTT